MRAYEIHLNKEKIIADGKYTPEQVQYALDYAFEQSGIEKNTDGLYVGKGTEDDSTRFASMFFFIVNREHYMRYIDKWLYYKNSSVEDVLKTNREYDRKYG